jgi:hypothetical protein
MNGFRFLYWDDYEAPKGDDRGKSSSTEDTPEDDSKGSRGGKDSI